MKNPALSRTAAWLLTIYFAACSIGDCQNKAAQPVDAAEQPDPYEWVTQSYSFPCFELLRGFTSKDRGELRHPRLPAEDADDEEVLKFVKESNSITSHFLDMQGMSLPDGVLVVFDPDSLTLTARAPRLMQSSIGFLADTYQSSAEKYLVLEASILEAPAAAVQSVVEKAASTSDHSPLKAELEQAQGSRSVFFGKAECRSGQRVKIADTREIVYPVDLEPGPNNSASFITETDSWGTSFEIDPVLGADDITIDLNYVVERAYSEPAFVRQTVNRQNGTDVTMPTINRTFARTISQITVRSGNARLVAAWAGDSEALGDQGDAEAKDNVMLAAFIETYAVKNLPVLNDRLPQMLKKHGDAIAKIPKGKLQFEKAAEEIPEGMIVRRYLIPPTFLSSGASDGGGGAGPVDPFSAPIESEPRFTRQVTTKDILQSAGITFPQGSSANYLSGSSTLVVRNTPENIELVEAYITSLQGSTEKGITMIAYVVQAPGDLLRDLARETRLLSNHEKQWQDLKQAEGATIVDTVWLNGRSGQRFKTEWGNEFSYPVSLDVYREEEKKTENEEQEKEQNDDNDDGNKADTNKTKIAAMSAGVETRFIGTVMEADPFLGADNWTVDVNFSLQRDDIPPATEFNFTDIGPNQELRLDGPVTRFGTTDVTTQVIFRKGAIRMVSLRKPESIQQGDEDVMQAVFLRVDVVELDEEDSAP